MSIERGLSTDFMASSLLSPGAFTKRLNDRRANRPVDPGLLRAVVYVLPATATIIDLGCGAGQLVFALRQLGIDAIGVDASPGTGDRRPGVLFEGDLTNSLGREWPTRKWALNIEVLEHIPAELQDAALANIAESATDGLIVSCAVPGQRGRGHVACHSPEWVAAEFGHRGWIVDELATIEARKIAGRGWDRKLLIFKRRYAGCSLT